MVILGRLRLHPWRTSVGVLTVAAVEVAVVWMTRPGTIDIPEQAHDPAKLAAATGLIEGLPVPADVVRDAYATSCRSSAPYCATSTTESARSLMKQFEQALRYRGARVKEDGCFKSEDSPLVPSLLNCAATLTYRGALIDVGAGDARTGSAPAPAYIFLMVPTDVLDVLAPQPSAPLPALAD